MYVVESSSLEYMCSYPTMIQKKCSTFNQERSFITKFGRSPPYYINQGSITNRLNGVDYL